MSTESQVLSPTLNQILAGTVRNTVNGFLIDRKSQGLSPRTIRAYTLELRYFCEHLDRQGVVAMEEMTADVIRRYLVELSERRNPGGCHIAFRVIKTFTYWWEQETDDEYRSPVRKVKAPKLNKDPLDPVAIEDVRAMQETCDKHSLLGTRDIAILHSLLDTGARAQEFLDIDLTDVDLVSGAVHIREGKGGKSRTVFLGKKARRSLRAYLKKRSDTCEALWVTDESERMQYEGLRSLMTRLSQRAGVAEPSLHAFRRAFAVEMLRAGVDLYTLQELMGHADLQVLRRYLKLVQDDLQRAHGKGSPVDNLL